MRECPQESATLFKVGYKKVGNDGNYYYVTETKNKVKRWTREACWFVAYKINDKSDKREWTYGRFPAGWAWIGGGSTIPLNSDVETKYPREEQFMGNPSKTLDMKEYLTKYFEKLKNKQIVVSFRVLTPRELLRIMK